VEVRPATLQEGQPTRLAFLLTLASTSIRVIHLVKVGRNIFNASTEPGLLGQASVLASVC